MTSEVKEEVEEVNGGVVVPRIGISRLEEEAAEVTEEVKNLKNEA